MSNLIKTSNDRLIKIGGKLIKTNSTQMDPNTPGLYDETGRLVKTWDELISEGSVKISE